MSVDGSLRVDMDGFFGVRPVLAYNEIVLSGAIHADEALEEVRVMIGDRELFAAHGLPRSEDPRATGFELRLDTRDWSPGIRYPLVIARDGAGREAELRGEIDVRPYRDAAQSGPQELLDAGLTSVWCDSPSLDGSARTVTPVQMRGWAWSVAGIEAVTVDIDGDRRLEAEHGLPAPELTERLGEGIGARGGFSVTFDPEELTPGWHELTVVARGADGTAAGVTGMVEVLAAAPEPGPAPISPSLLADRYVPEAHVGVSFESEHHARYRWAGRLAPGRRVLDAACGSGFGAAILAAAGADSVDAFDIDAEVVEHARARVGEAANIVVGDLLAIPYRDRRFDLVTCFESIEHVHDPLAALDELRRVLADDGLLLVSTPNRGVYTPGNPHHLHELGSTEFYRAVSDRFEHVRIFRQQNLATSLLEPDGPGDQALELRRLQPIAPGEELYMVAAASPAPLPALDGIAVLGSAIDVAARIAEARAAEARADAAERTAASLRVERDRLSRQRDELESELERATAQAAEPTAPPPEQTAPRGEPAEPPPERPGRRISASAPGLGQG